MNSPKQVCCPQMWHLSNQFLPCYILPAPTWKYAARREQQWNITVENCTKVYKNYSIEEALYLVASTTVAFHLNAPSPSRLKVSSRNKIMKKKSLRDHEENSSELKIVVLSPTPVIIQYALTVFCLHAAWKLTIASCIDSCRPQVKALAASQTNTTYRS